MKFLPLASAVSACVLSGCIGSTEDVFQDISFSSRSFSGEGVAAPAANGAAALEQPVSVFFSTGKGPLLTMNGKSTRLNSSGNGIYTSANGQYLMGVRTKPANGPDTPGVYYMLIEDTLSAGIGTIFVDGDRTPTSALSGMPTARYSGATNFVNQSKSWSTGRVDLTVDFGSGSVQGDLTGLNENPAARFDIASGKLSGSHFSGSLTSSDVTVVQGTIGGGLFGAGANSAAGTLRIATPNTTSVGLFGAVR